MSTKVKKLAPSLLAANFQTLNEDIKKIELGGAHYLHLDVMDGHFVNNISFGVPVIASIRSCTSLIFDVHLMIERPERYVEAFANAGADIINVHVEACDDLPKTIAQIKALGKQAAVTIKPNTDISAVYNLLNDVSMVLIMSVEPGFGGQGLILPTLKKAEQLATFVAKENLNVDIQMDGGITLSNVRDVLNSGVNIAVAGSSVFGAKDVTAAVKQFYNIFKEI